MVTHPESVGQLGDQASAAAGATRVYVGPQRDQLFLLPMSMREWLDAGHLAWFVIDVVGELDTGALHRRPGGALGRPPHDPEMMWWIQLVVATLDDEELRCNGRIPRWLVLWRRGCAARDVL